MGKKKKIIAFGMIAFTRPDNGSAKYLLFQGSGHWNFPACRPEKKDATPMASALRGLAEESGLSMAQVQLCSDLGTESNRYTFSYVPGEQPDKHAKMDDKEDKEDKEDPVPPPRSVLEDKENEEDEEEEEDEEDENKVHVTKDVVYYYGELTSLSAVVLADDKIGWFTYEEALEKLRFKEAQRVLIKAQEKITARPPMVATIGGSAGPATVTETQVACGMVPYCMVPRAGGGESVRYFMIQHHQGHWNFPNGRLRGKEDDSLENCLSTAQSEFSEQTSIQTGHLCVIPDIAPIEHSYEFTRKTWKGKGNKRHCILKHINKKVLLFVGLVGTGTESKVELQRSESGVQKSEFKSWRWASFEDAKATLSLDATKDILVRAHAKLQEYSGHPID